MIIKTVKNWKELADSNSNHRGGFTRREFLERGLATGTMSVIMSNFVSAAFAKKAMAADLICPPPSLKPGAIAQIFSSGGPTMGARFISDEQAALMNAGMARNYGISGQANLVRLGPNLVIDSTSPFGYTLLQGPPGYPGGAAAWRTNVLSKVSGGGHQGAFNKDDGAGENTGLVAGVSPFKPSQMGKDLKVRVSKALANWSRGLPASTVNNPTPALLAGSFSLTPAAAGLTNSGALTATSNAINSITDALSGVFGNANRKGAKTAVTNAGCAFFGNSLLADPTYGQTLFNPVNVPALAGRVTLANLTQNEQGQLAAFYQSAKGVAGGVILEFGGRDYHGNSPQNDISPKDIEEARTVVMFLAACDVAQERGAMIYLSNGQAIADGTAAVTATINGVAAVGMRAPVAVGDGGGAYNAGLIIFYNPVGGPVASKFTGTITAATGNVKADPALVSSNEAVAGLYLSALAFTNNGSIPSSALTAMQSTGVASNPSKIMVI
ncbi:MAG: hypothetical protein AABY53_03895 [Bdellovibrionota bacterium]